MSITADERVSDEIEALKAILFDDELKIIENERGELDSVQTLVFPSTGEDSQSQYVCIQLIVKLTPGYPDTKPNIQLKNPRGLDEETVKQIQEDVENKCDDFLGQPVLFELIELVKEHLTKSNLPTGECAICLYGFQEGDNFTKTDCYHYFHSFCLSSHIEAAEKYYSEELEKLPSWQQNSANKFQALCPVCRESIDYYKSNLSFAKPPIEVESATEFSMTQDILEMQQKMSKLYSYQKRKGGIIDIEAEEFKLLVMTEHRSTESRLSFSPDINFEMTNEPNEQKDVMHKLQKKQKHHQQKQDPHTFSGPSGCYRGRGGRSKKHRRHLEQSDTSTR